MFKCGTHNDTRVDTGKSYLSYYNLDLTFSIGGYLILFLQFDSQFMDYILTKNLSELKRN